MVRKYAAEGCNVVINYVSSKDAAEELAAEVREQYGVKAIALQGVLFPLILGWTCSNVCARGSARLADTTRVFVAGCEPSSGLRQCGQNYD